MASWRWKSESFGLRPNLTPAACARLLRQPLDRLLLTAGLVVRLRLALERLAGPPHYACANHATLAASGIERPPTGGPFNFSLCQRPSGHLPQMFRTRLSAAAV
jgi:hypothetical protein